MKFTDYRTFKTAIGGELLELEIGKVCELANGQVMVKYGDTVVNVTACASKEPRPDIDFFPLSCDYEEKMYEAGKIPGGFIKREGRPSEKAILNSRLMDRPLRPLFPKGFFNDVQVVATVMSVDDDAPSEIAAMIGSSVALAISDIPWEGPTGSVLVGMVDGQFVVNPSLAQREESSMHLVVSGTKEAIMMVEAGAQEVPEDTPDAIMFAHEEIKKIVEFIEEIVKEVGKPKMEIELYKVTEDIEAAVREYAEDKMRAAIQTYDKMERLDNMDAVEAETKEHFEEIYPDNGKDIGNVLYTITKEQVRKMILDDGIRPDNRKRTEIRPIWCDTHVLPRTHGSGLFKRGQTQVLSVATVGPLSEAQTIDGINEQTEKRYMHHYNFPPYSVGEAGRMKSPGRREIGHGALAERGHAGKLPGEEGNSVCDPCRIGSIILQRFYVSGVRMRKLPGTDGCRCSDQGSCSWYHYGSHRTCGRRRYEQDGDPVRHPGYGRLPGRHGLQGCRYCKGRYGDPDGHQGSWPFQGSSAERFETGI